MFIVQGLELNVEQIIDMHQIGTRLSKRQHSRRFRNVRCDARANGAKDEAHGEYAAIG